MRAHGTCRIWFMGLKEQFCCFFNTAGSLQLDLTSLLKPATTARSCKLPGDSEPSPKLDLFKQKRCYGWWATSSMKTGSMKSTVHCTCLLTCIH